MIESLDLRFLSPDDRFYISKLFGYFTQRISLSPILGYLIAGYAIGPFSPGFVGNLHLAEQLAEIGVMLMMFGVGYI